jgi:hypothetical protein
VAYSHTRTSLLVIALALWVVPGTAQAVDRSASPATLGSAFAAAQAGDRILLDAGDYGTFRGGQKSGTVTIRPAAGATASMRLDLNGASNLRFEGLTISRADLSATTRNVAVVGSRFTGMATLRDGPGLNILFDGNTHDDINVCDGCLEGRVHITGGTGNRTPNGIVISNSHFSGGNADGIQNGGYGTQIGPGNEFENLLQGDPDLAHTDPIQLYGSHHTHIVGNYLHDNEMTIMAADGPDHELIEHNVIVANHDARAVNLGSDDGSIVRHNTLIGTVMHKAGTPGSPSVGTVIKDNIITGGITRLNGSSAAEEDYNLVRNGDHSGPHDRRGTPVFLGGAQPSTHAGFRLAAGSPGKGAASDGTDMGALFGDATPPAAPPAGAPQAPATVPTIDLLRPAPGGFVRRKLKVAVTAADDSGIARVAVRLDRRRLGSDARAPYSWQARTRRVSRGWHTVTARAFANDGQVSSVAVTVLRRPSGHAGRRRAAARGAWRVRTQPAAGGGTVVQARGPARRSAKVALTRCGKSNGRRVVRLRLRTGRDRVARVVRRAPRLCVQSVRP